jgi:hypothetical protein
MTRINKRDVLRLQDHILLIEKNIKDSNKMQAEFLQNMENEKDLLLKLLTLALENVED